MSNSILVVDDEPGILEIAGAYLRREGFTVRTASTGKRALEAVATQPPDLIVLDLRLPDIPGEEVCSRLRRVSAVPILMLTAKSAEEDRVRGLAIGADDYLVKPFPPPRARRARTGDPAPGAARAGTACGPPVPGRGAPRGRPRPP
jgi:DNA-binding response OmpR family regulator